MKRLALLATLSLGLAPLLAAADAPKTVAPPTDAVIIEHAKVDDAFAKGLPMLINTSYKIQAGRRVMGGQSEIHERDTDIFYVTEGTATLVTGGKSINSKPTGPGEFRGDRIEGGVTRKITKGDLIVIPAGVPHWMSEVEGTFLYLVIKVTK